MNLPIQVLVTLHKPEDKPKSLQTVMITYQPKPDLIYHAMGFLSALGGSWYIVENGQDEDDSGLQRIEESAVLYWWKPPTIDEMTGKELSQRKARHS